MCVELQGLAKHETTIQHRVCFLGLFLRLLERWGDDCNVYDWWFGRGGLAVSGMTAKSRDVFLVAMAWCTMAMHSHSHSSNTDARFMLGIGVQEGNKSATASAKCSFAHGKRAQHKRDPPAVIFTTFWRNNALIHLVPPIYVFKVSNMVRRVCVALALIMLLLAVSFIPQSSAAGKSDKGDLVVTRGNCARIVWVMYVCMSSNKTERGSACVLGITQPPLMPHQPITVAAEPSAPSAPAPRVVEEKTLAGKQGQHLTVRYLAPELDKEDDDDEPTLIIKKQSG